MRSVWLVVYGSEMWFFETETQADNKVEELKGDLLCGQQ